MQEEHGYLDRGDGQRLAWRRARGAGPTVVCPTVVWMGGYRSDMGGTKAVALAEAAARRGWDYLRFDWFAHGDSSGRFEDATIGRWREDALAVVDRLTEGPLVVVGSSMGGWMACLAAIARPERIKALVLVAPAPDFTEDLMRPSLSPEALHALERDGVWMAPSEWGDPYPLTRRFLNEGRDWRILGGPVPIRCPVRVLQGMKDEPVPWSHAMRLVEALESDDVVVTLIKDGDHRLSDPDNLRRLEETVAAVA